MTYQICYNFACVIIGLIDKSTPCFRLKSTWVKRGLCARRIEKGGRRPMLVTQCHSAIPVIFATVSGVIHSDVYSVIFSDGQVWDHFVRQQLLSICSTETVWNIPLHTLIVSRFFTIISAKRRSLLALPKNRHSVGFALLSSSGFPFLPYLILFPYNII